MLDEDKYMGATAFSITELDSYANMPVVRNQYFIVSDTIMTADVSSFSPEYEKRQISLVDAAAQYDCPYPGMFYIIVIRNILHVPSMANNLISPLMMIE